MEKLLDPTESSDGETSPFKKFSNLSHARARAANPLLDFAMRRKFEAHFKNLQQSSKLRNGQPEANQVWSVDEIGIDVQGGCWPEFFSLGRHHGFQRSIRVVGSERDIGPCPRLVKKKTDSD